MSSQIYLQEIHSFLKSVSLILIISLWLAACTNTKETNTMSTPQSFSTPSQNSLTIDNAKARLETHLASSPLFTDAIVARVPALDIADFYAFSVMTSTGLAGELLYLVDDEQILTSGRPDDFSILMNHIDAGTEQHMLDVHTFAYLFLRLHVNRRGVILDTYDGHILLTKKMLPPRDFVPPQSSIDEHGIHYQFWIFDTDQLEPVFFDVTVQSDGTVNF